MLIFLIIKVCRHLSEIIRTLSLMLSKGNYMIEKG